MGERRLVALLKELPSHWRPRFYKHFTATRFFQQPFGARSSYLSTIHGGLRNAANGDSPSSKAHRDIQSFEFVCKVSSMSLSSLR
jgi:hypothetical protein